MPPPQQPPAAWAPPLPAPRFEAREPEPLVEMEAWQPAAAKRTSLAPAILLILVLAGGVTWLLQDDLFAPLHVDIPVSAPKPPPPASAAAPAPAPEATSPAPPEVPPTTPVPAAPEQPATPEPVVRRAELIPPSEIKVDLEAATRVAPQLFTQLNNAKTPAERAALLAEPEEHGADAEEFFAGQKLELLSFKLSSITPRLLPGKQTVPLFQVTTRSNPQGALLRLVPRAQPGTFLLDWPLFAETQQKRLSAFLQKGAGDPAWMHLGLRRSHGLDVPAALRDGLVVFSLQGAADGSQACLAVAPKNTPAGRYLDHETEWGQVYLARLLLQQRQLEDGTPAVFILDIEGAATSSSP